MAGNTIAATPIRVMSFNIRFDATLGVPSNAENAWLATSGQHRRDLALQIVADYDPDILCLQEALKNQLEDFRKNLSGHAFYGVGRGDGVEKGEYCGIFYRRNRFSSSDQGTFWLNENADQPGTFFPETCCARLASWIRLQDKLAENHEFLLLNTHWDHQVQEARLFSAKLIRQRLNSLAGDRPILLTGDLNVAADNPAFQLLVKQTADDRLELLDSFRVALPQTEKPQTEKPQPERKEGTFHAFRGYTDRARIDYVLHSRAFRTLTAKIVRNHEKSRYASDHFPVTATLILTE